jgi:lipopolysaccharide heptosyltransferase II
MDIKKVLFFKPGAIGDLLHALPALKALKQKFPAALVTAVVSPGLEPLIQGTSIADRVLVFDKSHFKKSVKDFIGFGLRLRREEYDLFVDMQPSARSFALRLICGARRSLVYRKQKRAGSSRQRLHAVENFLGTLRPLGVTGPAGDIELPVKEEARRAVDRFLSDQHVDGSRPLIALNCSVGAARPARNWFPERFAALADRLIRDLGAAVVFVGGPEDRELVESVMAAMKETAIIAAGKFSIAESAALLARCACLVSSDTGPLHLATAVRTTVVGLFGSTDPLRTGPVGRGHQVLREKLPCAPCEEKHCPLGTRACMEAIGVDGVFAAVRKAMRCE